MTRKNTYTETSDDKERKDINALDSFLSYISFHGDRFWDSQNKNAFTLKLRDCDSNKRLLDGSAKYQFHENVPEDIQNNKNYQFIKEVVTSNTDEDAALSSAVTEAFKRYSGNTKNTDELPKRLYFPFSSNQVAVSSFFEVLRESGALSDDIKPGRQFVGKKEIFGKKQEGMLSKIVTGQDGRAQGLDTCDHLFSIENAIPKWQLLRSREASEENQSEAEWCKKIESSFRALGATCRYEEIGVAVHSCYSMFAEPQSYDRIVHIRPGGSDGHKKIPDEEWVIRADYYRQHFETCWEAFVPAKQATSGDKVTIVPEMKDQSQTLFFGHALVINLTDNFYEHVGIKNEETKDQWPYQKLSPKEKLFKATREGRIQDVQQMLEEQLRGIDDSTSTEDVWMHRDHDYCYKKIKWTLLHEAAKSGQGSLIEMLLFEEPRTTPPQRKRWGQEQFFIDVDTYIEGRGYSSNKVTPLYEACQNGDEQTITALLMAGADVNKAMVIKDHEEERICSPYHYVQDISIKRLLLNHGADPNVRRRNGYDAETALNRAIDNRQMEEIRLLLDAGADPNLESGNPTYQSALFHTTEAYHRSEDPSKVHAEVFEMIQLLLEYGADIYQKGHWGKTFLFRLCCLERYEVLSLVLPETNPKPPIKPVSTRKKKDKQVYGIADIVKLLEIRDSEGRTPLMRSQMREDPKVVKLLSERGANLDDGNENVL